jgi:hypothetical protein
MLDTRTGFVVVLALLGAWNAPLPGQEEGPDSLAARVDTAVTRGLDYLRREQSTDGSWRADIGYKLMEDYRVTSDVLEQRRRGGGHVGVSSLALIAFLAGGHVPGRGPYGKVLERGIRYVLGCVNPEDGYISQNGSRMYSHAFATLCLAETYGMTHQADLRAKLQDAVDLIVKSQNARGSWRYLPFAKDSDMSITVCQVQALRAARNVGLRVPRTTIDRAIDYIKDSAVTSGLDRGAFKYQPDHHTRCSFPLTAAGITALYGAGVYEDDDIERGLNYLVERQSFFRRSYLNTYFYYYGHYYAVQAMFIAGGRYWEEYYPRVRAELLGEQRPDGSWPNDIGPGPAFGTAVACIILQIPLRYLPIFQK